MEEKKKYRKRGLSTRTSNGKLHNSKNRHLPIEEKLVSKEAIEEWKELRKDYELYLQDALIPKANHTWTSYKKLYAAYEMYCKAVGIPVRISYQKLGVLLKENFMYSHTTGARYGCIVRPGIFIHVDDEVEISEK